ncbi:AMP-dependent synthetase [Prauserella sp. PE36]|uniref:AMP-dependent synthetase n=1 Tax=Prauserella endophytica TaxID=1592324 RepID=A0ABY2S9V9_9PSEU|nr:MULTISPECIES: AMP-binding protein [Prauserella]RBM21114.1 AMP-dependent synthetase [Prauserella sp. PE36]TKG72104.1 AMP-dependent synthetase [Prauserella endophytica]
MDLRSDERAEQLLAPYDRPDASAAELLCDRHPAEHVALTVVAGDLTAEDLTFGELRRRSETFAAALAAQGIGQGDAVAVLMGKSADLATVLLGIWRLGAVHIPLFTAFATPAIALRLQAGDAKAVVVDAGQAHKLAPGPDLPEGDWKVIEVGGSGANPGWLAFEELMREEHPSITPARVGGDGTLVQLFTSGTTGTPKGVRLPVRALAALEGYLVDGLDVRPDDVYWDAADPGWAYGLYYAVLAPLAMGRRSIWLNAGFSAPLTWRVLDRFGVTNFAAAPTIYRSLRNDPEDAPPGLRLRRASSAGEPLTPEVVEWSERVLGLTVRDHYGQTELGMVIGNAWRDELQEEVLPGSMGRPLPGYSCEVLDMDSDAPAPAGTVGRVALDTKASPLFWFTGYPGAPDKTAERFTADGRWYLTGDSGYRDDEGRFFFSSRDDDVIIMAGYRIGPFDVESVLVTHPGVAEAAVVAAPDALRGEVIVAYVVLAKGTEGTPELEAELQKLVKERYAAHAYPRGVRFVTELPKTPSGKIQRFKLRDRERESAG